MRENTRTPEYGNRPVRGFGSVGDLKKSVLFALKMGAGEIRDLSVYSPTMGAGEIGDLADFRFLRVPFGCGPKQGSPIPDSADYIDFRLLPPRSVGIPREC